MRKTKKILIILAVGILHFTFLSLFVLGEENSYKRDIEEEVKIKSETEEILIERYYKYGEQLYREKNFGEAILQFRKVLELKPDYDKAKEYINKCKKSLKKQKIKEEKESTEILLGKLMKKEEVSYVGEKMEIDYPLDLKGCIGIALDNSIDLKKALKEIEGLDAKFQWSKFLFTPEVRVGFETYSEEEVEDVTSTRNRLRLLLTQPLYDAYKQHKILETKEEFTAAKNKYDLINNKVIYNVVKEYFSYKKAQRTEENFKKVVEVAKKKFDIVNALYKGGLALKVDLLKSEEILLAAEENLSFAEDNFSYARINLNQAMGLDPSIDLEIKEDSIDISVSSLEEISHLDYKNHPRYKELEEKIKITELDLRLRPTQLHPQVDIGVDHVLFGDEFPTDKGFTEFMFTVKVPIFAYLQTIGKGTEGEDLLDALELEKIQLQKELSSKAGGILLDYLDAKRRFTITGKRLKWAEEQFNSLKSLYKFGDESKLAAGTGREESKALAVLDAQLSLLDTKRENFQAEYDIYINTAKLREALGERSQDWLQEYISEF